MEKKEAEQLTNDLLIADALIRIKAIENLLIEKNILSKKEIDAEIKTVSTELIKILLEKSKINQNIDTLINTLSSDKNNN